MSGRVREGVKGELCPSQGESMPCSDRLGQHRGNPAGWSRVAAEGKSDEERLLMQVELDGTM